MHRILIKAALLSILLAWACPLHAEEEVKCPASRDVWLSSHPQESDFNMGAAKTIKLKFIQEFGILDFDVKALKGKKIIEAYLYVKAAGGHKWGLNGGTDLRHLSVATVGHDWVEGKSGRYAKDTAGFGATFKESSFSKADWGWPGARAIDVSLGNSNSYRAEGELKPANGWHRMPLDLKLVRALIADATHGLLILDGTGDVVMNCAIFARESGKGPYLTVKTGAVDAEPPAKVTGLKVEPAPNFATTKHGAARVTLTVPKDAFAYQIKVNGQALERWQIPFAAEAGATQSFEVLDLAPGADLKVEVVAVDEAGNLAPAAEAAGKSSPVLTVPNLPAYGFQPKGGEPKALGAAKVWAFPEVTKVDPVKGVVQNEKAAEDFKQKNAVWDGADGTIRLAAAKGEIVSFQVAVEGAVSGANINVSKLEGPGTIPETGLRLWRNWYVKGHSEYAIPLKPGQAFDCPMADNKIEGQTLQAVTVDYHIPVDAKAGAYTGTLTVAAGEHKTDLKLKVEVYDVTIPETVFFNPELNCYGGPGQAGSAQWFDSYRLAHYHRATINRVPYSQSGRTHGDYVPKTGADGKVTDWSDFDKNIGPLLSGEAFKNNPRAGVPVATLYLPQYEGYPLNYRDHYQPGCSTKSGDRESMTKHHVQAKPIEEAMSEAYKKAFVQNVADFYNHFKEQGWNRTACQMYLNNKGWKGGYALWTLDEPYKYADWAAINFWGELWKQGANDPAVYTLPWHQEYFNKGGVTAMNRDRPTFLYRGDISRSDWQGSASDKNMTILYGGAPERILRGHRTRMPAILYTYGAANGNGRSNWESAAWCLRAYSQHQDGVLPWQSLGGESAFISGDKGGGGNSLIVNSGKLGFGHAVASFRLHAMRRGAQDCELLRLLQLKLGLSREHMGLLTSQRVPIISDHLVSDAASAVKFQGLNSQGFAELKEGLLKLLSQKR